MRRKSERAATKKAKTSPEKKVEKVKQTRTRRKKQSTSSENESVEEPTSVPDTVIVVQIEENPPLTPAKEMTAEEAQVWRVKASEGSGDAREIQKLKICLTRPPSTPERVDRSPRSKRKHSRATSSSDTPIVEITEDRKKSKHRSKRLLRESKDGSEKNQDSYGEEQDNETTQSKDNDAEVTQSDTVEEIVIVEAPMSTTSEEVNQTTQIEPIATQLKPDQVPSEMVESDSDSMDKTDADTTVVSPNVEPTVALPTNETPIELSTSEITIPVSASETAVAQCSNETTTSVPTSEITVSVSPSETIISVSETETIIASEIENQENKSEISTFSKKYSPERKRSVSVDKSEILELHAEESKCESDSEMGKPKEDMKEELTTEEEMESQNAEVSISRDKSVDKEAETTSNERNNAINETDVVVSSESEKELRNISIGSGKDQDMCSLNINNKESEDKNLKERHQKREIECSDSVQSNQEEPVHNGQSAPIVVSRKRRWGSRPKLTSQKSITISTDVLKEIIPDVKPVEFNEVIEDKKHKREVVEKIERPVLPKIIIDNTDNIERRKENVEKDKENVKVRESHLAMNRKISIVKENESIIARPPSPPRHKQSCILFITNLVRPFTEQQLKNLLQRTGRFVDNGFWIDKIKSKCFVIYQTEEQAVETRHALHGVTWPVSNPKTLQVDFSTQEAFDKAKLNEDADNAQVSTMPDTMDDWIREQDLKRERGEQQEKPWERKAATREWDLGKNDKEKEKLRRDDRPLMEKRRHRTPERSPEPARKFKKKEEEAPAKLLDDLFRKTKTTPCIYWLPLSADMIAIKEEQRRQHMADHERRLQEQRRTHRRH